MGRNLENKRKYQRNWVAKRRADWFSDKFCINCGSLEKLELHHINPKDKIDHKVWNWTEARRLLELAKCVVLCHNCHLEVTKIQISKPVVHGNHSTYAYGCRCLLCKAGHNEYMKEYRLSHKKEII